MSKNQQKGQSKEQSTGQEATKKISMKKAAAKKIAMKKVSAVSVPAAQHAAWYQLLRAHGRVVQGVESRLLRAGQIPHQWYDVLVALEKAPQRRLRLSELADHIVTSRSNLTRLVDRLEAEGLLRREACPNDRRGSYAVLTPDGAKARLAAWPTVSRAIVEMFASHVNDEEAAITTEVLRRIADAASEPGSE